MPSEEESFKLLAAYCILGGDTDHIAKYMGITKNAVGKRYTKLISTEKEKLEKAGFVTSTGTPSKKRTAPISNGDAKAGKKAKTGAEESNKEVDKSEMKAEIKKDAGEVENGDDD